MSYCKLKPESKLYDDIFNRIGNRENSLFLYEYFNTKDFKNTYKELSKTENIITSKQHNLTTNDDTCKWFRRLGGSESKTMAYTLKINLNTLKYKIMKTVKTNSKTVKQAID